MDLGGLIEQLFLPGYGLGWFISGVFISAMARGSRKPLILQQTSETLRSILDLHQPDVHLLPPIQPISLSPGLLFFSKEGYAGVSVQDVKKEGKNLGNEDDDDDEDPVSRIEGYGWDEATMVGLSVSALRDLSLSSGSWVTNSSTNSCCCMASFLLLKVIKPNETHDARMQFTIDIIRVYQFNDI